MHPIVLQHKMALKLVMLDCQWLSVSLWKWAVDGCFFCTFLEMVEVFNLFPHMKLECAYTLLFIYVFFWIEPLALEFEEKKRHSLCCCVMLQCTLCASRDMLQCTLCASRDGCIFMWIELHTVLQFTWCVYQYWDELLCPLHPLKQDTNSSSVFIYCCSFAKRMC